MSLRYVERRMVSGDGRVGLNAAAQSTLRKTAEKDGECGRIGGGRGFGEEIVKCTDTSAGATEALTWGMNRWKMRAMNAWLDAPEIV